MLDRRVRAELRGLPKELAEVVAAYLLLAGQLIDEDPELAYAHAEAARRRAARLPIVREATAETAYAAGKFDVALGEYRALRRMTGNADYLPVMADCERALGRTDAAMRLVREGHEAELSVDQWAELRMVEAGIRDDLGQRPEALRVLAEALGQLGRRASSKRPELREALARMHYAYGELLLEDGDQVAGREAFATAADLDVDGVTDAPERVDLLDGMDLVVGEDVDEDDDEDHEAGDHEADDHDAGDHEAEDHDAGDHDDDHEAGDHEDAAHDQDDEARGES
jgi:tetratricopeptide (TPR) repeat protein